MDATHPETPAQPAHPDNDLPEEGEVEQQPAADEQDGDATPTDIEPTGQQDTIQYDPDTRAVMIPTPIPGMFVEFHEGQQVLNRQQMRLLAPLEIKAEWDPDQVLVFLLDCQRRGFDPWAGEAFLMRYNTKTGPRYVKHIGIAGFRRRGEESGQYRGRTPIQWCGSDGVWKDVWLDGDNPPVAARVGIRRAGFAEPVYAVAQYDEFCPLTEKWVGGRWDDMEKRRVGGTKRSEPTTMWKPGKQGGKASLMNGKCAEAQAWRAAFPSRFNGWYAPEEFDKLRHQEATTASSARQSTDERRQAAYRQAMQAPVIDGTAVDVTDLRQRLSQPDARDKLLTELGAQAEILGFPVDKLTAKWEAARGGKPFAEATTWDLAMHVHRYREYVIEKLRGSGEPEHAQRADRYAKAPAVGDLAELFGELPPADEGRKNAEVQQ